ncbi:MAG: O-antigen ligase family protein [Candidatus Saccharimonadales bacterium]
MALLLFLAVTATLFVRPAEIITDLAALPIYEWLIMACLAASAGKIVPLLSREALISQPITLGVVGMLAAVFLSHASHGDLWSARYDALEFSKMVIYYLLVVANVNSPSRLRLVLFWLLGCIAVLAVLALLQYHGVIHIQSLAALEYIEFDSVTEREYFVRRICGMGIFNDPNDLSMMMVVGTALAVYFFFDPRVVLFKLPLAVVGAAFLYAVALTQSRGGLLALLAALGALFQARYGWKKSLVLLAGLLPLIFLLVSGRQSDLGDALSQGTGQSRIQLWSEGLQMLRANPFFGLGYYLFAGQAGQVAHNSYVQAFAELGFFGGTIFLGAWCWAVLIPYRLGQGGRLFADHELCRLRPYLLAAVAGYAGGMGTLTRIDVVPTYLVLGLSSAYTGLAQTDPPLERVRLDGKLVVRSVQISVLFLAAIYLFVHVFARWSS